MSRKSKIKGERIQTSLFKGQVDIVRYLKNQARLTDYKILGQGSHTHAPKEEPKPRFKVEGLHRIKGETFIDYSEMEKEASK